MLFRWFHNNISAAYFAHKHAPSFKNGNKTDSEISEVLLVRLLNVCCIVCVRPLFMPSLPCGKGARTEVFLNACVGSEHLEFNSMNSHLIVQWELWVKEGSERSVWASSMVWVTQPTGFSCWTGPGPIAPETGRNRIMCVHVVPCSCYGEAWECCGGSQAHPKKHLFEYSIKICNCSFRKTIKYF